MALLVTVLGVRAEAQTAPANFATTLSSEGAAAVNSSQQAAQGSMPDAPGQEVQGHQVDGRIYGTVTDPHGNVVAGANVTLEAESSRAQQAAQTDTSGLFTFPDLGAGNYRITIAAKGFADWARSEIALSAGQYYDLPGIVLKIAPANTNVEVTFTRYDEAEEQIKAQEQQRILAVFPNFYASYVWHAVPMTPGQKFRLALRTSVDPVTFGVAGATAGIEQSQNYFSGYGQGGEGFAKRFGAAYADDVIDTFIGSAILPSILHQDPRYFYKGTGSIPSRAFYAISTVVICRGDNGRWQPNYSNVAGNLISAGISNLYYPASNRDGATQTIGNALISTAEGAATALLQEFVIKKISRGVQQQPPPSTQAIPAKLN
jgi:Carboxypeptidase regulatory-like domain